MVVDGDGRQSRAERLGAVLGQVVSDDEGGSEGTIKTALQQRRVGESA